jgi:phosphoribosylcarboxyaminoimidazole (NCAIR) mutase
VHRKPRHAHRAILKTLRNNDVRVFVAGAHSATGLPGVIAGYITEACLNTLVLGVRFTKEPRLSIMEDAAFGVSSMPRGVPLAYTGFNNTGFLHACMLSAQILAMK